MTHDGKVAADNPTDEQLVHRVQQGDHEAFTPLVQRHQRSAYWMIESILHNQADTEEVLQETFLKALQHIGSFRGEARFATWNFAESVLPAPSRGYLGCNRSRRRTATVRRHRGRGLRAARLGPSGSRRVTRGPGRRRWILGQRRVVRPQDHR